MLEGKIRLRAARVEVSTLGIATRGVPLDYANVSLAGYSKTVLRLLFSSDLSQVSFNGPHI